MAADQSDVPDGYVRGHWASDGFSPLSGGGPRFGINGGYRLGRGVGQMNGFASSAGLTTELNGEAQFAIGRMSLSLGYGQFAQALQFAGSNELHFQADQITGQFGYALISWFSLHVGAASLSSLNFGLDRQDAAVEPGHGYRYIVGANVLAVQHSLFNFGLRIEGSGTEASGKMADGSPASFSGNALTFQPYITMF